MNTSEAQLGDVGQAYIEFRPVLYRALATLAKRGFALHPADGNDFIHDFFLEQWEAVRATFDPAKGTPQAYVYSAFVRFARPRIVKLRRLQDSLVEPKLLDSMESYRLGPENRLASEFDVAFLLSLINHLPSFHKEMLMAYLHSEDHSERSVAKQFSVSRYRAREVLVEALARVVTAFPKPSHIGDEDWSVAYSVWKEGRTLRETAVLLQVPLQHVKNSVARVSYSIGRTLRDVRFQFGGRTMTTSPHKLTTAGELLQATLSSVGNEQLLGELKRRAKEVLAAIDAADIPLPERAAEDPVWLARVYEALCAETKMPLTADEQLLDRALFETQRDDLTAIGKAFVETLLPDLPVELVRFAVYFADAPRISAEELQLLSSEPDVRAAFPISADLLLFGIRPVTVFYAAEAVSALLDRLLRYGIIGPQDLFLTVRRGGDHAPAISRCDQSISIPGEIAQMTGCDIRTSSLLLEWLLQVAEYKPFVFAGFEADLRSAGVLLKPTLQVFGNLYQRWSVILEAVH
jgi:DNA-directed RNA polymerase specialized sigma24 family protein